MLKLNKILGQFNKTLVKLNKFVEQCNKENEVRSREISELQANYQLTVDESVRANAIIDNMQKLLGFDENDKTVTGAN